MQAAENSWVTSRYGRCLLLKVSHSSFSWAPGMPKTHSVPSAMRASVSASAPDMWPVTQPGGPPCPPGSALAVAAGSAASPVAPTTLSRSRREMGEFILDLAGDRDGTDSNAYIG